MSGLRPNASFLLAISALLPLECPSTSNNMDQTRDTTGKAPNTVADDSVNRSLGDG